MVCPPAVGQAANMGLYVSLDFHSNSKGDQTFYNPTSFISNWEKLLKWGSELI